MKKMLIYHKSLINRDLLAEKLETLGIHILFIDDRSLDLTLEEAFQLEFHDSECGKLYQNTYVFMYGLSDADVRNVNEILKIEQNDPFILVSYTETNRKWQLCRIMKETEEEHKIFVKSTEVMSYIRAIAQKPANEVPKEVQEVMVAAYTALQKNEADSMQLDSWIQYLRKAVYQRNVYVFGAANIDICGRSDHPIVLHDSNIGETSITFGGVGRNIAQFLASMGETPRFVSCFSKDLFGRMMLKDCEEKGIDCSLSVDSDRHSSYYLAVLDHLGDMHVAVNDMKLMEDMDPQYYADILHQMHEDDILVVDANLNEACLHAVFDNAKCIVAADPVSAAKVSQFMPYLQKISFFKANQIESEKMTGIKIEDTLTGIMSLDWFLQRGIKEIAITLGKNGVLFGNSQGKWYYTHPEVTVINATGGGDSFMSGYLHCRLQGKTANEAIRFAICTAIAVIGSNKDERENITEARVRNILEKIRIEEHVL